MATAASLDTRVDIIAPENIAFQYRIAGPFQRLPAYLIDVVLRGLILLAIALIASLSLGELFSGYIAMAVILVTWFVLSWFYGGLFEALANGQTPGKRTVGLRVLTVDGEPIAAWQAVLRNILRAADAMPLASLPWDESSTPWLPLYMFGLIACLVTRRYQRLGDLACGTMVVVEQRDLLSGIVPVAGRGVIELANDLPVGMRLSRSLARALAAYVSRRESLSPARREEMARSLGEALATHYSLPAVANYDQLLCAFYYRAYITDHRDVPTMASDRAMIDQTEEFQIVSVQEPVQP